MNWKFIIVISLILVAVSLIIYFSINKVNNKVNNKSDRSSSSSASSSSSFKNFSTTTKSPVSTTSQPNIYTQVVFTPNKKITNGNNYKPTLNFTNYLNSSSNNIIAIINQPMYLIDIILNINIRSQNCLTDNSTNITTNLLIYRNDSTYSNTFPIINGNNTISNVNTQLNIGDVFIINTIGIQKPSTPTIQYGPCYILIDNVNLILSPYTVQFENTTTPIYKSHLDITGNWLSNVGDTFYISKKDSNSINVIIFPSDNTMATKLLLTVDNTRSNIFNLKDSNNIYHEYVYNASTNTSPENIKINMSAIGNIFTDNSKTIRLTRIKDITVGQALIGAYPPTNILINNIMNRDFNMYYNYVFSDCIQNNTCNIPVSQLPSNTVSDSLIQNPINIDVFTFTTPGYIFDKNTQTWIQSYSNSYNIGAMGITGFLYSVYITFNSVLTLNTPSHLLPTISININNFSNTTILPISQSSTLSPTKPIPSRMFNLSDSTSSVIFYPYIHVSSTDILKVTINGNGSDISLSNTSFQLNIVPDNSSSNINVSTPNIIVTPPPITFDLGIIGNWISNDTSMQYISIKCDNNTTNPLCKLSNISKIKVYTNGGLYILSNSNAYPNKFYEISGADYIELIYDYNTKTILYNTYLDQSYTNINYNLILRRCIFLEGDWISTEIIPKYFSISFADSTYTTISINKTYQMFSDSSNNSTYKGIINQDPNDIQTQFIYNDINQTISASKYIDSSISLESYILVRPDALFDNTTIAQALVMASPPTAMNQMINTQNSATYYDYLFSDCLKSGTCTNKLSTLDLTSATASIIINRSTGGWDIPGYLWNNITNSWIKKSGSQLSYIKTDLEKVLYKCGIQYGGNIASTLVVNNPPIVKDNTRAIDTGNMATYYNYLFSDCLQNGSCNYPALGIDTSSVEYAMIKNNIHGGGPWNIRGPKIIIGTTGTNNKINPGYQYNYTINKWVPNLTIRTGQVVNKKEIPIPVGEFGLISITWANDKTLVYYNYQSGTGDVFVIDFYMNPPILFGDRNKIYFSISSIPNTAIIYYKIVVLSALSGSNIKTIDNTKPNEVGIVIPNIVNNYLGFYYNPNTMVNFINPTSSITNNFNNLNRNNTLTGITTSYFTLPFLDASSISGIKTGAITGNKATPANQGYLIPSGEAGIIAVNFVSQGTGTSFYYYEWTQNLTTAIVYGLSANAPLLFVRTLSTGPTIVMYYTKGVGTYTVMPFATPFPQTPFQYTIPNIMSDSSNNGNSNPVSINSGQISNITFTLNLTIPVNSSFSFWIEDSNHAIYWSKDYIRISTAYSDSVFMDSVNTSINIPSNCSINLWLDNTCIASNVNIVITYT